MTRRQWEVVKPYELTALLMIALVVIVAAALFSFSVAARMTPAAPPMDVERSLLLNPVSLPENDTIAPPLKDLQPCEWLYKAGCRE